MAASTHAPKSVSDTVGPRGPQADLEAQLNHVCRPKHEWDNECHLTPPT